MAIRDEDKRQVSVTIEGLGDYVTYWPNYEYLCHECGKWKECSNVTHVHDDGSESPICEGCAAKIIASGIFG